MNKFRYSLIFALTFLVGFYTVKLSPEVCKFRRTEQPRFANYAATDSKTKYFTLEEGKKLLGRKVYAKGETKFPYNHGRIAALDLVVTDKFLIIIDWEISPINGKPSLVWMNKDYFAASLTVED